MGCAESTEQTIQPSIASEQDEDAHVQVVDPDAGELAADCDRRRQSIHVDKEQLNDPGDEDGGAPENDFFDFEEEEVDINTQEFMAVKPWIGAVVEPDDHPPVNKDKPDQTYCLEHVYGYRCQDSRQNVYYNADGNIVYITAALGVILDKANNTQTFFGGGEVENESKQVANTNLHHTNDVMCLNVNTTGGRNLACSGQVGKNAPCFIWDTSTGERIRRVQLPKNCREVSACAIHPDGEYFATVDKSNDHYIRVFKGTEKIYEAKGGPDHVFDMAWNKDASKRVLWSAGVKHFYYWDPESSGKQKKKGLHGDKGPITSHAAVTADDQGRAYSGGSNSGIYVWKGNTLAQVLYVHAKGFIGAVMWQAGKLYSGGRDGKVCITNTDSMECERAVDFGWLPRAIDVMDNLLLVGLRNGSIIECNLEDDSMTTFMQSHNDGEVWGLAQSGSEVCTSGDDNQIICWNVADRKVSKRATVNEAERKAKKNKASTLGRHPESQCARALAVSEACGKMAACANDGSVTIRDLSDINTIIHEIQDASEWIEVAQFSPDGAYLAVGSHDTNIYLYETGGFSLLGKCTKHNATLTCIDWSMDSTYIRSVCNAYELLFFTMPDCSQDPSGASNTTGTSWASQHCKFGWCVDGIFPRGTDGTHINGVDASEDQSLIACGDDYGLVQVFRNPCRKGGKPRSFRGHSEHVVRVAFGRGELNNYMFSVGGYDQTVMQWKLSE